jgi:ribosomal protein S18 acetylase RimI-like enzyme
MTSASPTSSILVRRADEQDVVDLGRLGALLVAVHHDFDPSRFIPATAETPALYADFLETRRKAADAVLLVADDGGVVVGYAFAEIEGMDFMALRGPAGVLHDLVVDPACQGRGIGRLLVDAVRAELIANDTPRLVLSTAARNVGAQALFAALGFRPTMIEMTLDL